MANGSLTTPAWPRLDAGWQRWVLWLWIGGVVAVTVLSLLPALAPPAEYGIDKLIHAAGYCALALLPHAGFERRKAALAAALAMIPLGCAIEVAQNFVPNRFGDIWDALADSGGVLVGIALGMPFRQIVSSALSAAR